MKLKPILILFSCALAMGGTASAEVPSLINYQGRLTGPGGTPASGTRNFELKVYDAQAGGNLLYTEDVGTITLGEGGVYSFQFGGSGTSMATRSETLATTDGTLTVFNHALSAPALPGSVAMSDGTFTWSQAAGSSAPANFIGSFVGASGIASAIYIQGAPAAGTPIEVTYQYEEAGIVGALSSGSAHWLELTVNGNVQATRERVLAVPFALVAGKTNKGIQFGDYEDRDPNELNYEPKNGFLIITGSPGNGHVMTVSMGNDEGSLSPVFSLNLGSTFGAGERSTTLPIKAKTYWRASQTDKAKFIAIE